MQTGKPASITLTGYEYMSDDSVTIMQTPYNCDLAALTFAEAISGLFQDGGEGQLLVETALGMGTARAAKLSPTSVSDEGDITKMTLPEFTIYQTGTYNACWKSADGLCSASAGSILVSGRRCLLVGEADTLGPPGPS